ncbi:nucleotide exchange factor GrpE [Cardinium endosymbiont of Bemisia tabaci]|uniref:nucleotide exchange factor GrpE n=1 Tax=Cardinium endosymbiont of Bemisia tabaci TaxID=672794 RepID=UPI000442D0D7|nr:nucleotide exchange factor GrpE [Cardinium endosymbiont of Bemisia tabaci]CDG49846.1 Protein grpE [Cardinium endosymbiont cBtQ1 of Bemisia tabaci]
MKLQDTHTNQTGCCASEVDKNQTDCCNGGTKTSESCCCSGEEIMDQPCCCSRQEVENQINCDNLQETELHMGCCQSRNRLDNADKQMSNPDISSFEQLQSLLKETNDKYLRLYAEFDNFKKRTTKEHRDRTDRDNKKILKELLPIVDDFERCMMALQGTQAVVQHLEGIKLIYDKLCGFLKKCGVQEIAIEQGSAFNADLHEAIMQQPVDNLEMQGKIVTVVEKGYLINEYVLRFAKVIIGV